MKFKLILSSLLVVFLSGCQTKQKAPSPAEAQNFKSDQVFGRDGKVEFIDLKKNKSNRIDVEAFIVPNKKMRLEATGPLGIRVATIVVTEDQIQAQLYREKKYLHGAFPRVWERENPTLKAISIPISPRVLQAIVLDWPLIARNWKCQESADGSKECRNLNPSDQLPEVMNWSPETNGERTVTAESSAFKIKWTLKPVEVVAPKANMFILRPLENYQDVDITPR